MGTPPQRSGHIAGPLLVLISALAAGIWLLASLDPLLVHEDAGQHLRAAVVDDDEALCRVATRLLEALVVKAPARNREVEAEKARARNAKRFG